MSTPEEKNIIADREIATTALKEVQDELDTDATAKLNEAQVDYLLDTLADLAVDIKDVRVKTNRIFVQDADPANTERQDQLDLCTALNKKLAVAKTKAIQLKNAFTPAGTVGGGGTPTASSSLALPRTYIPKFDGNKEKWLNFKTTFETLIHNNMSMPASEKYLHLKGALEGQATNIIDQITTYSDQAYDDCWKAYKDRYDSRRELALSQVQKLFKFNRVIEPNSENIHQLIDTVKSVQTALHNQGLSDKLQLDLIIFSMIFYKCNTEIQIEIGEYLSDDKYPVINDILGFLETKAKQLASVEVTKKKPQTQNNDRPRTHEGRSSNRSNLPSARRQDMRTNDRRSYNNNQTRSRYSSNNYNTQNRGNYNRPNNNYGGQANTGNYRGESSNNYSPKGVTYECFLCEETGHGVGICPKLGNFTPQQRKEKIRGRLCDNCLSPKHKTNECKKEPQCTICKKGRHHTILHNNDWKKQNTNLTTVSDKDT